MFFVSLMTASLFAQEAISPTREAEPVDGIAKFGLKYFKIKFTPDQRRRLDGVNLELAFSVDELGNAVFEDVLGTDDEDIKDSLRNVQLAKFTPRIENGKPIASVYMMRLSYPAYDTPPQQAGISIPSSYRRYTLEDFEYLKKSGSRLEIVAGGLINGWTGELSSFNTLGGGMKIDMLFTGTKKAGIGLIMSFYSSNSKKDYPIATMRPQERTRALLLLGPAFSKIVQERGGKHFMLQLEPTYAVQNIVVKNTAPDDPVQLKGFSFGLVCHYVLPVGKERLMYSYGTPSLVTHCLNVLQFAGFIRLHS